MRQYDIKQKIFRLGDIAQNSDAIKYPLWIPDHAIKIASVKLGADTAVSAADTNYNTFKLTDGTNTIASLANGPAATGQDFVAGSLHAMTLDSTYAEVDAATQLEFEVTKTGNGLALSGAYVQVNYYDNNA